MNTKLLRKVRDAILAEPLKFDMDAYFQKSETSPCGTAACIAGHTVAIERKYERLKTGLRLESDIHEVAEKALVVGDGSWRLFYVDRWPYRFSLAYGNAVTSRGRARIAARRIDHFIKTNGED